MIGLLQNIFNAADIHSAPLMTRLESNRRQLLQLQSIDDDSQYLLDNSFKDLKERFSKGVVSLEKGQLEPMGFFIP